MIATESSRRARKSTERLVAWAMANFHGAVSAPRVTRTLMAHGLSEREAATVVSEVARESASRCRRAAWKQLVGGIFLVLLPTALLVTQLILGNGGIDLFHGIALLGFAMLGRSLVLFRRARSFRLPGGARS